MPVSDAILLVALVGLGLYAYTKANAQAIIPTSQGGIPLNQRVLYVPDYNPAKPLEEQTIFQPPVPPKERTEETRGRFSTQPITMIGATM